MNEPVLRIYPSVAELQNACAIQIAQALRPTLEGQMMTIALSGGSTPRRMHELLVEQEEIDWSKVHVFWGDERMVPSDHPDSNYRMARESLLDRVPIPEDQIHRMPGELDPDEAAREYERVIREVFDLSDSERPRFDIILLGMGADGHTASLFPGTEALHENDRLVVANHVPQLDTDRLTLTYPVLNAAKRVFFLVAGADKADAAARCIDGTGDVPPARHVNPADGELRWLLDSKAGSQIIANG